MKLRERIKGERKPDPARVSISMPPDQLERIVKSLETLGIKNLSDFGRTAIENSLTQLQHTVSSSLNSQKISYSTIIDCHKLFNSDKLRLLFKYFSDFDTETREEIFDTSFYSKTTIKDLDKFISLIDSKTIIVFQYIICILFIDIFMLYKTVPQKLFFANKIKEKRYWYFLKSNRINESIYLDKINDFLILKIGFINSMVHSNSIMIGAIFHSIDKVGNRLLDTLYMIESISKSQSNYIDIAEKSLELQNKLHNEISKFAK